MPSSSLQKSKSDNKVSLDVTMSPSGMMSCCLGNLSRKKAPLASSSQSYVPTEKLKLPSDTYSTTTPETRFASTLDDPPPPVYSLKSPAEEVNVVAARTSYTSPPDLSRAVVVSVPPSSGAVLPVGIGFNRVPREVVQGVMNVPREMMNGVINIQRNVMQGLGIIEVPREVLQGVKNVPASFGLRLTKEREVLQSLWLHHQQRQAQTVQRPLAIGDWDSPYVFDKNTNTVYKRGRLLGKGGFARCYELIDVKSNKTYAGKIISKCRLTRPRQMEKIIREVELHRGLHHPNVVEFHSFFEDDLNVYMVLENCSKKTLMHLLKARKVLTEPEVRYYMRHLVDGCRYVHSKRIVHRDLKLGNMLLNEMMEAKLADFGLATRMEYEGEKKMTVCGTPNYIAPEVLQKKGHSYEADTWALGCIMYALLCGRPPFETATLKETYARINANKFHIPSHISPAAQDLICKLLDPEPSRRPQLDRIFAESFFVTGFTPARLPSSSCEVEPRFTALQSDVRIKSAYAVPTPPKNEIKAVVPYVENGTTQVKRSVSQKMTQIKNVGTELLEFGKKELPIRRETFAAPTRAFAAQNPRGREKPALFYPPRENVFPSKQLPAVKCEFKRPEPEENVGVTTRKPIYRSSTQKRTNARDQEFIPSAEKKPPSFGVEFFHEPKRVSSLSEKQAADNATQYARTPPRNDFHIPKTSSEKENLKEDRVASACSPIRLFKALSRCLEAMPPDFNPTPIPNCEPLWVTKWVDYSNKYGFGFQLSNETVGLLFNDTTRMILSNDNKSFIYNDLSNKVTTFAAETAPAEQRKKVTLLLYFVQYMNEHLVSSGDSVPASAANLTYASAVFMKKWFRTDKAVVMYLNNGTLQINFLSDHTKLIVSVDGQDYLVTYVDSERQMSSYRLLQLTHFGCSVPIDERLRYAHRMLENIMNWKEESV